MPFPPSSPVSSIFNITEHVIDTAHIREYARATSNSQHDTLLQHVKQYTPKDNPNPKKGDVTIIGAHANGFPKEMYEPLWEDIYHQAKAKGIAIRSIIMADAAWQGQSGALNKGKLGNDPAWYDYGRDIAHMINTLRPPPPLVGISHSFGSAAIIHAALANPRLFNGLVIHDPVIKPPGALLDDTSLGPTVASTFRREAWPSREAAAASFAKSSFYQAWDKRVLDRWVQYGLVDQDNNDDGEAVTLSTTKHQEVFTFLRPCWPAWDAQKTTIVKPDQVPDIDPITDSHTGKPIWHPFYRAEPVDTYRRLPHIRPPLLYIFGGQGAACSPEQQQDKVRITGTAVGGSGGAARNRVEGVVEHGSGHLVPMENPRFCAEHATRWIESVVKQWSVEEREYEEWARRSEAEKTTLSDEYKAYAKECGDRAPKANL